MSLELENSTMMTSSDGGAPSYIEYPFWVTVMHAFSFLVVLISGLVCNLFILCNCLVDPNMRTTNYFFVLNLVTVDIVVILGFLVVKEVAILVDTELLKCFPSVWNFVVNFCASNYFLLFLCYEKFVLIITPFKKATLLRSVSPHLSRQFAILPDSTCPTQNYHQH